MLYDNLARIAGWAPMILIVAAVASAVGLWATWKNRTSLGGKASRHILTLSIIALIVAYGPMAPLFRSAEKLRAKDGETFPDLEFTLVGDGSPHHLADYQGKVILVNLWATWCPPCREELPALNKLQQSYRDRGVVVLTLSDEPASELTEFLGRTSPDTLNGSVTSFGWLAIRDFRPWSVIIDRSGHLRDYVFGAQDYATFERKILPLL